MKQIAAHQDERLSWALLLSDDEQKLFLNCSCASIQNIPTYEELLAMLSPHISVPLLDEAVLKDIVKLLHEGKACEERRIAKGTESVAGRDGKIVWLVKRFSQTGEVSTNEKGFVDFLSLNRFDNISKGQLVARIYPPQVGQDGTNAVGKPIRAGVGKVFKPGLDKSVKLEKHTSGTYEVLVALEEGYVLEESSRISIQTVLDIKGDVDLSIGSIDFIGSVTISGDVQKEISIKSKCDILISGSVQGDNLFAAQKSFTVKGTHFGGENSGVAAKDFYKAKVARLTNVDVDGPIYIEKEALECTMRTRNRLDAGQAKIVGGSYWVVIGAEVGILGNAAFKKTDIILCGELEASKEWSELLSAITKHEEALELIRLHLGNYVHQPIKIARLLTPHREKMQKLQAKLESLESSLTFHSKKKEELVKKSKDIQPGKINIVGAMFPGAEIHFGESVFHVEQVTKGPFTLNYNKETKEFIKGEYSPFEVENEKKDGKNGKK